MYYKNLNKDNQTVSVTSIYGKYIIVTPQLDVSYEYSIPMNVVYAKRFFKSKFNIEIDFSNFKTPLILPTSNKLVGSSLKTAFNTNLKYNKKKYNFESIDKFDFWNILCGNFKEYKLDYSKLAD